MTPVQTRREFKAFIVCPYRLFKNYPAWTPPLVSEVSEILIPGKNPFFEHARMQLFLARQDNKVIGRIAAIIDQNFIDSCGKLTGLFGFFDSIDDIETANALFNTASNWLREEGMKQMLGPTNPSMNDEIGVLQNDFDRPAVIKMVWNPEYYTELYDAAGLKKAMDIYAWSIVADQVSDRLKRMGEAILKRSKVTIRTIDLKNFQREVETFRKIYNEAWSNNWGFVPWTEAEFNHVAKAMKQIIDKELVLIAEDNGTPVGFSLALPDLNIALRHINGRLFPFGLPLLLWHSRKIHRARIAALGVVKKYRNRGIDTALYYETYRRGIAGGYNSCEMSWILENNASMNKMAKMMGATQYRTYRLYERKL